MNLLCYLIFCVIIISTATCKSCVLTIPSQDEKGCYTYDLCRLTDLKSMQYEVNGVKYFIRRIFFLIILIVGGNVADAPESCNNIEPSTGYKVDDKSCVSLGINKTEIVVPTDLENRDKGVRMAYIDGEKISKIVTRMFSMDFICDKSVSEAKITNLLIRREYYYYILI